jgi:phosphate starvation-inducible protein PhoH
VRHRLVKHIIRAYDKEQMAEEQREEENREKFRKLGENKQQ